MIDLATLEEQALGLSIKERGHLASVLLRSLDDEGDTHISEAEIEQLWIEESRRRNQEMDDDPSIGIPIETVMQEMRDLLK